MTTCQEFVSLELDTENPTALRVYGSQNSRHKIPSKVDGYVAPEFSRE